MNNISDTNMTPEEFSETSARVKRTCEVMLLAAQYQSKVLSELLASVDRWGSLLPPEQALLVRGAMKGAEGLCMKLNQIVGDRGIPEHVKLGAGIL